MTTPIYMDPDDLPGGRPPGKGRPQDPAVVAAIAEPGRWVVRKVVPTAQRRNLAALGAPLKGRRTGGCSWEWTIRRTDDGSAFGVDGEADVLFIRVVPE